MVPRSGGCGQSLHGEILGMVRHWRCDRSFYGFGGAHQKYWGFEIKGSKNNSYGGAAIYHPQNIFKITPHHGFCRQKQHHVTHARLASPCWNQWSKVPGLGDTFLFWPKLITDSCHNQCGHTTTILHQCGTFGWAKCDVFVDGTKHSHHVHSKSVCEMIKLSSVRLCPSVSVCV